MSEGEMLALLSKLRESPKDHATRDQLIAAIAAEDWSSYRAFRIALADWFESLKHI